MEQAQRQEENLHAARLEALHSRSAVEIQGLVHDLKTPLTSIQGLAGVIQLKSKDDKIAEYAYRIEQSVDPVSYTHLSSGYGPRHGGIGRIPSYPWSSHGTGRLQ